MTPVRETGMRRPGSVRRTRIAQQDDGFVTAGGLFETASGAESAGEFRRRGIASYVAKPFDLWDVVGRVKRLATNGGAL